MANAQDVLRETVTEAAQLANTGGTVEQLQPLLNLARTALNSSDGEVPDDVVRKGGLHATGLSHLGLL